MQMFKPTSEVVKNIGRYLYKDDILWLALSGSGIEFTFAGKDLSVAIVGDDFAEIGTEQSRIVSGF